MHYLDEANERDARRLRQLEFLRSRGVATMMDEREALEIKRRMALREFDKQEHQGQAKRGEG